jgi:molecular chaperone GrpE
MELVERGCEGAWKAILPVLDDMERAIVASHKSDDIEALRQGEELVMKKFESVLQAAGITAIECVGQPFNEEEQEAVARFAAGEDKRGLVIDCVQRGYKLGEHVLRYAKVVVGE